MWRKLYKFKIHVTVDEMYTVRDLYLKLKAIKSDI